MQLDNMRLVTQYKTSSVINCNPVDQDCFLNKTKVACQSLEELFKNNYFLMYIDTISTNKFTHDISLMKINNIILMLHTRIILFSFVKYFSVYVIREVFLLFSIVLACCRPFKESSQETPSHS